MIDSCHCHFQACRLSTTVIGSNEPTEQGSGAMLVVSCRSYPCLVDMNQLNPCTVPCQLVSCGSDPYPTLKPKAPPLTLSMKSSSPSTRLPGSGYRNVGRWRRCSRRNVGGASHTCDRRLRHVHRRWVLHPEGQVSSFPWYCGISCENLKLFSRRADVSPLSRCALVDDFPAPAALVPLFFSPSVRFLPTELFARTTWTTAGISSMSNLCGPLPWRRPGTRRACTTSS